MEKDKVRQLLEKYKAGTCTPNERAIVESWYLAYHDGEEQPFTADELEGELERIWGLVNDHVNGNEGIGKRQHGFRWIAAAAVLLVGLVSVFYFYRHQPHRSQQVAVHTDLAPGGNRATLTLADGSFVELSSDQSGVIMKSEGPTYADGSTIPVEGLVKEAVTAYTIRVPRGGQYQVVLADGSRVWLNSESTLHYPARFSGPNREVEVEGEAFFEVFRDVSHPFVVRVGGYSVNVLGTAFNVSSYDNEPDTRITLVNGSVRVKGIDAHGKETAIALKPGEQAVIEEKAIGVKVVDIAQYTAWRDGIFKFNETELRSVLRQLSRWYDVHVEYPEDIPATYYYGQIGMDNNLSAVLRILKESGLHFSIENNEKERKLVVHR